MHHYFGLYDVLLQIQANPMITRFNHLISLVSTLFPCHKQRRHSYNARADCKCSDSSTPSSLPASRIESNNAYISVHNIFSDYTIIRYCSVDQVLPTHQFGIIEEQRYEKYYLKQLQIPH